MYRLLSLNTTYMNRILIKVLLQIFLILDGEIFKISQQTFQTEQIK
jgi:hypothetical protein